MSDMVVIIDDEPDILNMLKRAFMLENISVRCFTDSQEGLGHIIRTNAMTVILDIKMPKISGIEMLREIRSYNPLCNVIMITGFSSMSRVVECLENGAIDYFVKPFRSLDEIIDATKNSIKKVERWKSAITF